MIMFKKILYCKRGKEETVHKRVGSDNDAIGDGALRLLFAITTFGVSGTMRDVYYSCKVCSKIKKVGRE